MARRRPGTSDDYMLRRGKKESLGVITPPYPLGIYQEFCVEFIYTLLDGRPIFKRVINDITSDPGI